VIQKYKALLTTGQTPYTYSILLLQVKQIRCELFSVTEIMNMFIRRNADTEKH